jgi:hypothetical protein
MLARRLLPTLCLLTLLSACATPEQRVRNGLVSAGLSRPMASCMAARMVDRLNLLQLRRLGRIGDVDGRALRTMTLDQLLDRTRALRDPEILSVTTTAAGICALTQ